jgi:riboflavin biosynthesis pyrimidine reductase
LPSGWPADAAAVSRAADCERRIQALYGADLRGATGVLHVAAAWRTPAGELANIAMVPESPRSRTDSFALGLVRARADAIVTTGACLRVEPGLRHALADASLEAWRREHVARPRPPLSVVLTTGRDLDLRHAFFAAPALVFTRPESAARIASEARDLGRDLEVVGREPCDGAALLHHLQVDRGLETIDVETGPATAAALYAAPARVEELLLSIYCESKLAPAARAGPFVSEARIEAVLGAPLSDVARDEPSGRWRFRRYRRAVRAVTDA